MDIQLNFINQSNDANNSDVVIFQKNVAANYDELAVAWTVIQNCGVGDNHPFTYPLSSQIAYGDSWGNYTPRLDAAPGQQFSAVLEASGDALRMSGPSSSPGAIELVNALPRGAINANIYKAGRLFATEVSVAPGQKAVFEFQPRIWIGVASEVAPGQPMNAAIISAINTELSLFGIASADIVMTGGGHGPQATPFTFTLQNVVMA
ncbi:MAG: hypothetical protein WDN24_21400 [Sphingomonas sp.]